MTGPGPAQKAEPPVAVSHVSVWLGLFVIILLALVLILSALLIRVSLQPSTSGPNVVTELLEAQARDTKDPAVLVELGFEFRKRGLLDKALEAFQRALALDPRNVPALYHEASVLLEMGKPVKAEEVYWTVLEIEPTHAQTAKALGELYASRGQFRSLLVAVKPAAEANPALADLQYLLGLGLERAGDRRAAARAYWNALERDPSLTEAREGLDRVGGPE